MLLLSLTFVLLFSLFPVGDSDSRETTTCASNNTTGYQGPDTGSIVEVLWETPGKWSPGMVTDYDERTSEISVRYDSSFEHSQTLEAGEWKLLHKESKSEYESMPVESQSGEAWWKSKERAFAKHFPALAGSASAVIGTRILVYWDRYSAWHQGKVGDCKVEKGQVVKCEVKFDTMGTYYYDLRHGSDVTYRIPFRPDGEVWQLPRLKEFDRAPNFMEIDVPIDVIEEVREWYEAHVLPLMKRKEEWDSYTSLGEKISFYRQFAGGKFGSDIKWISPSSASGFDAMHSFFDRLGISQHVSRHMDLNHDGVSRDSAVGPGVAMDSSGESGGHVVLYIPSLVVRVAVNKVHHHLDWPEHVGSNGLTFMSPLYDMSDQEEECNLLYKGEPRPGESGEHANGHQHVYKYTLGKAAVFGGGTYHASQPCTPRTDEEKRRPWAFLCFNFGTDRQEYWDHIKTNIECSGKYLMQPNGVLANPARCGSYNKAYDEDTDGI